MYSRLLSHQTQSFFSKVVFTFCVLLIVTSNDSIAGELDITQGGYGSEIDGRVISENKTFDLNLTQTGNENLLAFILNSDVRAVIVQDGNYGTIYLDIKSHGDSLIISQHGLQNKVDGTLSGSVNDSRIIQNGRDNELIFDISGSLNNLLIDQSGTGNEINLVKKTSESMLQIFQSGSSNEIDIQSMGDGIGLNITQSGSNEKISIYQ